VNRREEILNRVRAVPALPKAAVDVIALLQNPEVSATELVEVMEYDPVLTSNILRVANSAFFGGPRSISTLREAIVRLGLNRIFQLAMTSAIAPYARKPIKGYDLAPGELLKHAVAVGIGTEQIAEALERPAPAYAFTAGLLHNLGKIVLGSFLETDAEQILAVAYDDGLSFQLAEQKVLGKDHAEVGAVLMESWNLPAILVNVVRWHPEPERCPGDTMVVDLVHVADSLSVMTGVGMGIDSLNYHLSQEAIERLDLSTELAEAIIGDILTSLSGMQEAFSI